MTGNEARDLIFGVLAGLAPEIDTSAIDETVDLTLQLDLDSMDYLSWMIGISEETGLDIPHRDVPKFLTIAGAIEYLVAETGS